VGKYVRVVGYADDLVLIAENPRDLQDLSIVCEKWSLKNGLIFSPTKSKVQKFNCERLQKFNKFVFTLNGVELETVSSFTYLGILLNATNNFHNLFIKAQITKAKDRLGIP